MKPSAFLLVSLPWFAALVALGMYQSRAFASRTRWLQRCGILLFAAGGLAAAYFHTGWVATACGILAVLGIVAVFLAKRWSDRLKRARTGA